MYGTQFPFASMSCADPRITPLLNILDGGKRHRERKFGGALLYCVNPLQLATDLAVARSFEEVSFRAMILLSHDDCAMLNKNHFCRNLREARARAAEEGTTEIAFQLEALKKLSEQFQSEELPLYLGVINTALAIEVTPETQKSEVLDHIITWVGDQKPPLTLFE